MIRFLQYAFIAIIVTTVGFSLYQWNASRAALKVNTNLNLNTNGLVGHWTLDGADTVWTSSTAGTTLDTSGSGNTGTLSNMNRATTPTLGKLGQALSFDGTNDYVNVGNSASYPLATPTTYSAWIYPNSSTDGVIVAHNCSTIGDGRMVSFLVTGTNQLTFRVSTSGSDAAFVTNNNAIVLNTWQHVAVTWDGDPTSGHAQIYVNGTAQSVTGGGTGSPSIISSNVYIGQSSCANPNPFLGKIDDVRIYNRALSASEISDLYRMSGVKENTSALQPQGIGSLNAGLTGYWKFDDGSGSTAVDSSTNGNTGTLVSTPTWITGRIGGGLTFNGTNYVSTTQIPLTSTVPNGFSIFVWLQSPNADAWAYDMGGSSAVNLMTSATGTYCRIRDASLGFFSTPRSTINADGNWHNFGCIFNRSTNELTLYVDGVSSGTVSTSGFTSFDNGGAPFYLGGRSYGTGGINGSLDEVRIYNRVLSADEISKLYQTTTPTGVDTGLKGYWSLDGNAVNWTSSTTGTAIDLSGANNTGTLSNMNQSVNSVPGKLGQGMFFTRSSTQRVLLGTNEKPVLTNDYSIAFWVYPTKATTDNTDTPFVSNYNGYGGVATTITDSGFFLSFYGEPGDTAVSVPELSPNRWYFITGTRNSVTGVMNLYKDGVLAGTGTKSTGPLPSNLNGQWSFGQPNNTGFGANSNGCGCRLDEIRMYDRVLSLAEITDLYKTGAKKINTTQNINTNGLVGHWTLDGKDTIWSSASAGTTLDTSGNSNTGTLTNMSLATTPTIGKLGQALSFDGVNDYVNVPYNASFDIDNTQSLSVSLWFKATSFPVAVYSKLFGKNSNTNNTGYECFIAPGEQRITCRLRHTSFGSRDTQTGNINLNQWYHLTYVIDGTGSGTGTIYLDGVAAGASVDLLDYNISDPTLLKIGSSTIGSAGYFTGSLDDVRIYNRVLSSTEISALYTAGR